MKSLLLVKFKRFIGNKNIKLIYFISELINYE
jgi:hypothetical protein